jgi:hypothetical protein
MSASNSPYLAHRVPLEDTNPQRGLVWLNGEWDFAPQSEYAQPKADEWSSVKIRIPSPWNVNSFSDGNGPGGDFITFLSYPKEWGSAQFGWHKRTFGLTADQLAGKRIVVHFDAVMYEADVYINGVLAGQFADGFLPFEFDITDMVKPGVNEIMVGVRNFDYTKVNGRMTHPSGSFWGEHVKGIWQDVYLRLLPEAHVSDLYVTTSVREKKINIEASITNSSKEKKSVTLALAISAAKGTDKSVPKIAPREVSLAPGETRVVTITAPWESPRLWAPESPFLYHLNASLKTDKPIDQTAIRFGFREFWIEGSHFILNGLPIRTNGDAWHFMGVPQMTEEYARTWYEAAKATHIGIIRPHAQVYPKFYYDLADEMGMLLIDENATWASHCNYQYNDDFWARATKHAETWVKRDRNHPSVVIWSVDNEINGAHGANPNDGAPSWQWLVDQIHARLVATIQKYDKSRPISGDGDNDQNGQLPIFCMHYPGNEPPQLEHGVKPVTIGEVGPMYYSTPEDEAKFVGDVVYESFANRLKAMGIEMNWNTQHHRVWTEYSSPFNMAWYSMEQLPFAGETWTYPTFEGPGMKPDRMGPFTSTFNAGFDPKQPKWKPNAFYPYLQDSFVPQRFFFDQRNVRFYGQQAAKRTITIHNDVHRAADIKLNISVTSCGKQVASQSKLLKMQSAGLENITLEFTTPLVKQRTDMDISVSMSEKGKILFEQTQKCSVFPVKTSAPAVSVLGSDSVISGLLAGAGIEGAATDITQAPMDRPLVIMATSKMSDEDRDKLMARIKDGLRVVFFGPLPWNGYGWQEKENHLVYTFPADTKLPVFRGMTSTDLQLWAGDGERVVNYTYEHVLPANSRALLFCGNGNIGMYEQRLGKGRIIGCGLEIGKVGFEPAAGLVLANLINYAATAADATKSNVATTYIGPSGSTFRKVLTALGADYSADPNSLAASKLAIIDGNNALSDKFEPSDLRKFVEDGGKALVWELSPDSLDQINAAFGTTIKLEKVQRDVFVKARSAGAKIESHRNGLTFVEGVLAARSDGSEYLRQDAIHPSPSDVNVSKEIIKKNGLKVGDTVTGWAETPTIGELHFKLACVECVNDAGRVDPLLVGVNNSDLYWIERGSKPTVVDYSVEALGAQVLVKTPNVNWHAWLSNGENTKTSAILKSEVNPEPTANALIRIPLGKGEIIVSQIIARVARDKSRRVVSTILENLGVPMTKDSQLELNTGVDEDGFIRSWLVSGPYSAPDYRGNDLTHEWIAGEATLIPEAGDKWKKRLSVASPDLDFQSSDLFPNEGDAAAYAAVYVWSARSGEVLLDSPDMLRADLRVGSDDGVKIWLNGKEIWSNPAARPMQQDNDVINDVKLKSGWNLLLLKVGQAGGQWQVMVRFTDPKGRPIEDLKYSTDLPDAFRK